MILKLGVLGNALVQLFLEPQTPLSFVVQPFLDFGNLTLQIFAQSLQLADLFLLKLRVLLGRGDFVLELMEPFSLGLQSFVCIGLFLHRGIAITLHRLKVCLQAATSLEFLFLQPAGLLQVRGQLGDLLCSVFRFLRQLANLTLEVLKLSLFLL